MSSLDEEQPDAWQQNVIFTELLHTPDGERALATLETHLKPIFNSHAFYSLETGMLTVKLQILTSLLTIANLLPHFTPHDFKLGLHLAIAPTLSQSASPSKDQPLHFDSFVNAVAFCAFYYPPQSDPLQAPNPRVPDCSVGLDVALDTVCDRLVASVNSPRRIVDKVASPATALAFATPRTAFPESSPADSNVSAAFSSPGAEQWFTPAPSAIRTKLFPAAEPNSRNVCNQDSDDEASLPDVDSSAPSTKDRIAESETKPEACCNNLVPTAQDIVATSQFSEREQPLPSETPSGTLAESMLESIEISSPPIAKSHESEEETSLQGVESMPQVEESSDRENLSEGRSVTPTAVASPSILSALVATPSDETKEEPAGTLEVTENDSPDSAPTNVSLAPCTALSHLPSREGRFEGPVLTVDSGTPHHSSSIEPMSSRKLCFSDSDEASDDSSCYENGSDNEDTMMRIENAFEDSQAVGDCEEEDANSDLLSSHSQLPSLEHDDTVMVRYLMKDNTGSEINLENTGLMSSSEGETESGMETASQTGAHDFVDSHPVASDSHSARSAEMLVPDALHGTQEKEKTCVLYATHDISLREPNIILGLPAGAFSEAGSAILRTPIAPATAARFPDTNMDDTDDEDHTLLFEHGNESDGSELSMGTRETMSKMVEDYLSVHGTASPQYGLAENSYAEDQVLMTPDRKSHEAFCGERATHSNKIIEDGPCLSEKAETKQSRITCLVEHSTREFGKDSDGDKLGYEVQLVGGRHDVADDALSPLLQSEKDSFSSEITPDGLNLIKKQLVLPSPFVFADSPVGSSMSSGSSVEKGDKGKTSEETETGEQQSTLALVKTPLKKEQALTEGTVLYTQHDANERIREVEMMRVMRETLETCRVLREEIVRKRQIPQDSRQRQQCQHQRGFGRWIEAGIFGLLVVFVTLVLVERRIQRDVFLDVLV